MAKSKKQSNELFKKIAAHVRDIQNLLDATWDSP